MSDDSAARAYQVLAPNAIGQLIGGLESLWSIRNYRPNGFLRGRSAVKRDAKLVPLKVRELIDSTPGAVVAHSLGIIGAGLILTSKNSRARQVAGVGVSLLSNRIAEYRNPYGRDGSDQMSGVIYSYRLATALIPETHRADELFLRAVNTQVCIAYAASGLAKLISSTWRSGDALRLVLLTDNYGGTPLAAFIRNHPELGKALSWITIVWESAYPVIYLTDPKTARLILLFVKGFHAGIAVTMGLPRFFWGFSASHSAVEYVIERRWAQREV
jgi:hypothetical protein